ncbi:MAG: FHA domain-containing protein [Myxococcaceae bacterium]
MALLRAFGLTPDFRSQTFGLPERGQAIVGRLQECAVCLPHMSVRGQHCHLRFENGGWRLYDLSRGQGVFRNGERLDRPTLLMHGDLLMLGRVSLVFLEGHEARSTELEAAVEASPGDRAPLLVWADWLQEQRDPLGERISRAVGGAELANEPWSEGLWREESAGQLELEWKNGLIAGVTLRVSTKPYDWPLVLTRALALRAARFLERLSIDVVALSDQQPDLPAHAESELDASKTMFAVAAAPIPRTLRRLELGYSTEAGERDVRLEQLRERFPRLEDDRIFIAGAKLALRRASAADGLAFDPDVEVQPLVEGLRLRADAKTVRFEAADPLGTPGVAEFRTRNGRWMLTPGSARAVRVNGRLESEVMLMPGDRVEIGGATFRVELG